VKACRATRDTEEIEGFKKRSKSEELWVVRRAKATRAAKGTDEKDVSDKVRNVTASRRAARKDRIGGACTTQAAMLETGSSEATSDELCNAPVASFDRKRKNAW
jgi:hypothetical protein